METRNTFEVNLIIKKTTSWTSIGHYNKGYPVKYETEITHSFAILFYYILEGEDTIPRMNTVTQEDPGSLFTFLNIGNPCNGGTHTEYDTDDRETDLKEDEIKDKTKGSRQNKNKW